MIFEKGDKIVFIGDSIMDYDRKRPVGEGLDNAWGASFVSDVGALLESVHPEQNLRVVNMGVGGDQTRDLLARWKSDVLNLNPDWVVVLIGINDVWRQFDSPAMPETHVSAEEFRANYRTLIERTLPHAKGMVLMTPFFMEPNRLDPMRVRMDEYGGIVRDLAAEYGLVLIDTQQGWDAYFSFRHPYRTAWDRIHPNRVGCMVLARMFLKGVGFEW